MNTRQTRSGARNLGIQPNPQIGPIKPNEES